MNDYATKQDVQNVITEAVEKIDKRFDDLVAIISQFANDVDARFTSVDAKLTQHDEEFRKLNAKYDHLVNTIDGFIGRIDRYETELAARDHKIDRLERWIQQIADTNGIKLTA